MGELDFAMSALGFRAKKADGSKNTDTDSEAKAALDAIAADGSASTLGNREGGRLKHLRVSILSDLFVGYF